MNEKVKAFYEAVSADGTLQEELIAVTEGIDLDNLSEDEALQAMANAVAEFAAAHDLDLTAEDVLEAQEAVTSGELSEEELAAIGGGALSANGGSAYCFAAAATRPICIIGGSEPSRDCGCAIFGIQRQ